MNTTTLIQDERHSPDSSDIWRAAIRRGWRTARVHPRNIAEVARSAGRMVYYGNTLHAATMGNLLPVALHPINPAYLPSLTAFTKRKMDMVRFGTVGQPFSERIFAKPIRDKWFEARVYQPGQVISGKAADDDLIYLSEPVRFTDEVRCFVLNGKVLTASYYILKGEIHDSIPAGSHAMFNLDEAIHATPIPEIVERIHDLSMLPAGVVMDFALTADRGWVLIEFNEAWCSGVYYCDYDKCLTVMEHSQAPRELSPP